MLVKHQTKGVRNVPLNVGKAMIKAGVAVACDESGESLKKPKAVQKPAESKKEE